MERGGRGGGVNDESGMTVMENGKNVTCTWVADVHSLIFQCCVHCFYILFQSPLFTNNMV